MITCKLREGFTHWENGTKKKAGDICHLTEGQFHAFRDRFEMHEPKAETVAEPKAEPKVTAKPQTVAMKPKVK